MIVEKAGGGEQMCIRGVLCLYGGEEGGFEEKLLAPCDEMVFWRARVREAGAEGQVELPGSPFHMLRKTWMWLATCFFERSTPLLWR